MRFVYSKPVRSLVQWSLCSLDTLRPEVAPSLRSECYTIRPSGHIETLDLASNYYIGTPTSLLQEDLLLSNLISQNVQAMVQVIYSSPIPQPDWSEVTSHGTNSTNK